MKERLLRIALWLGLCSFLILPGYFYFYPRVFDAEYAVAQTPTPTPSPTTPTYTTKNGKQRTMNLITTNDDGDDCLNTEGLVYKSVIVTLASGTATWDISFSNDNGLTFSDLWTDEEATNSYEFQTEAMEICINVSACANCDIDVTMRAGNGLFTQ